MPHAQFVGVLPLFWVLEETSPNWLGWPQHQSNVGAPEIQGPVSWPLCRRDARTGLGEASHFLHKKRFTFWTRPITHPTEMSQGEPSCGCGVEVCSPLARLCSNRSEPEALPKSSKSRGCPLGRGTPPVQSHCKLTLLKPHTGFALELAGFSPAPTPGWNCTWGISLSAMPCY